jgi:hypothetical protein
VFEFTANMFDKSLPVYNMPWCELKDFFINCKLFLF